jgi:hypothetical protein
VHRPVLAPRPVAGQPLSIVAEEPKGDTEPEPPAP